jgi:hypothetical protein
MNSISTSYWWCLGSITAMHFLVSTAVVYAVLFSSLGAVESVKYGIIQRTLPMPVILYLSGGWVGIGGAFILGFLKTR